MYTIGSLANLISGSDTPKEQGVKVKEVKYEKPAVAKSKINKKANSPAGKKPYKNGKLPTQKDIPKLNKEQTSDAIIQNKKLSNTEKRVILKRKVADLISGSDTPKEQRVKVKEVKYEKPAVAKSKINKKANSPAGKKPYKNGKLPTQKDIPKLNKEQTSDAIIQNKKLSNTEKRVILKRKVADLISGSDTPKEQGVKVKKVKYEKPAVAKSKINKKANSPAGKKPYKNGKLPTPKDIPELNKEQTSDAIIQNKKLSNAEKRVILKRKVADSGTPKKPKKPKIAPKVEETLSNNSAKTIFVGNVPLDTKEKEMRQFFAKYGKVDTIRFRGIPPADMKTPKKVALFQKKFHPKRKTMIAYVVFKSENDARNATNADGQTFKDHHLRINKADNEKEYDRKKSVFIGNLPLDAEEEDIRKLFNICGEINNVRLVRDNKTNVGKGFGFVNFKNADSVEFALQLEHVKLGKRDLRLKRCTNPEDKNKKKTADGKKIRERYSVHINNLPKNVKETDIRQLFKKCGKILSVRISKGNQKDTFCYINFENSKAVGKAVNMKNPTLLGQILKINGSKSKLKITENMSKYPAIFINNIPLNTTKEQLLQLFLDCGNIVSVNLFLKKTRETGVGFVNFEDESSIEKALKKNVSLGNNKLGVSRKVDKKPKIESEEIKQVNEDENEAAEDESDADEELVRNINGQQKWEDDSDSSETDDDDDEAENMDDDAENNDEKADNEESDDNDDHDDDIDVDDDDNDEDEDDDAENMHDDAENNDEKADNEESDDNDDHDDDNDVDDDDNDEDEDDDAENMDNDAKNNDEKADNEESDDNDDDDDDNDDDDDDNDEDDE